MAAAGAIAGFVGPIAGKYIAKKALDANFSPAEATKLKDILGLEAEDLRPRLDLISEQLASVTNIVKDIQQDVIFISYNSLSVKLDEILTTFFQELRKYEAAEKRGKVTEEQTENLRSACEKVLLKDGASTLVRLMAGELCKELASRKMSLLRYLSNILESDFTSVFAYSKQMNALYLHLFSFALLTIRAHAEAKKRYKKTTGVSLDLPFKLNYDRFKKFSAEYTEITARAHRLANRLRDMAAKKSTIFVRWAVDETDVDLFLTGYGKGVKLSRDKGSNNGEMVLWFNTGGFTASRYQGPPQILALTAARGEYLTVQSQQIAPHGGTPPVHQDEFNYSTASQLWEVGIEEDAKIEYLTLKNVEARKYLGGGDEWKSYLTTSTSERRWKPILCTKDISPPSTNEDDALPFMLQTVNEPRNALHRTNHEIFCNVRPDHKHRFIRWQILSETIIPGGTTLLPGATISSANRKCAVRFEPDGRLKMKAGNNKACFKDLPSTQTKKQIEERAKTKGGNAIGSVVMQTDGNFVIHDKASKPMFATNTDKNKNAYAEVTNDGKFRIVSRKGEVLFSISAI